jgi:hypothetical protein
MLFFNVSLSGRNIDEKIEEYRKAIVVYKNSLPTRRPIRVVMKIVFN